MTQPGETDGLDGLAHLAAVERYAGERVVDAVLANTRPIPLANLETYSEEGSEPVEVDEEAFRQHGTRVVGADLLAEGSLVRHDPVKLGRAVLDLLRSSPSRRRQRVE